jgi:arylsulfatase A-like enzyme
MRDHEPLARNVDRPIAALIRDLKSRGMLDDTLVVCTTEFGRTPEGEGTTAGRNHHNRAFSSFLAGGGVKAGIVHGKTDEFGREVVEDPVTTHDFHATILHLLGFDHERLTYRHGGRDFRLTDVKGNVVREILS